MHYNSNCGCKNCRMITNFNIRRETKPKKKPIDNEKYSSILLFKNAVVLLVSGATAKGDLELEEVLEALGEVKRDYEIKSL